MEQSTQLHSYLPLPPLLYKSSTNTLQEIRKTSKGKSQGAALAEEKGLEAFQGLILHAREQDTNETGR